MATTTWTNHRGEQPQAELMYDVPASGAARPVNVGHGERLLSLAGGTLLALQGLSRGRLSGMLLTAFGLGLVYRGSTGYCAAYDALGIKSAERSPMTGVPAQQGFRVEESITIQRSPEELFSYWRNFENLPELMPDLVKVEEQSDGRSHWVAKGPFGNVEWDAEIITERPNELISWRSVEGSQVDTAGSVHFEAAPGDRGTRVRVNLKYNPPGGKVGATLAWLMGRDAQQEIRNSLRAFKRKIEMGELLTNEGQPRGQCQAR